VLYHAFVNVKQQEEFIADNTVVPYQSDSAQMTRKDLKKQLDTQLGDALVYDLSEGHALMQVDAFRFRNHRMLLETLHTLQTMQSTRKNDNKMVLKTDGEEDEPAADVS